MSTSQSTEDTAEVSSLSTVIASGTSAAAPLAGQSNRSGPNFSLLGNNDGTITINAPAGYIFDIKEDKSGNDPTPVPNAMNGKTISGTVLSTGKSYYIANPRNSTAPFTVTLTQ
jgi:hypothetical protein